MMMDKLNSLLVNLSPFTAILLLVVITVTLLLLTNRLFSDSFHGPGPWGIPILGFLPFLRKDIHIQLSKLAKKYGDAYFINLCGKRFIHLSSHDALRETHVKNGDCFPGRSTEFSLFGYIFKDGVVFLNDEPWRVVRKFIIKCMKELGLGARAQMKDSVSKSLTSVIKTLNEKKGEPVAVSPMLSTECSKVIQRMMLGDDISTETVEKINNAYILTLMPMEGIGLLLFGNIGRYLVAPWIKSFSYMYGGKKELDALFTEIFNDHKKKFNPEDPKDFIDLYLLEKKIREEKGDPHAKYFTDKIFLPTIIQIFGDGGMTVGLVLTAFLKSLAQKIEIQNAMYEEIRREIGTERYPSYEDRTKLPYVNAVIRELERATLLAPVSPSLECSCETTIRGVRVPKGTITLVNSYAIHNDPAVYKDPQIFNPKRFLPDKDSNRPKEEPPILFHVGKRACPGEDLVRTEIFFFLTALMQHFTLHLADPSESKERKATDFQDALDFKIIATPR